MYSIAFRSCKASHLKRFFNQVNIHQHVFAATVSHKHFSTESKINNSNVPTNDPGEWKNVYKGMLAPRIRNLKIVSFVTSGMGLLIQPLLLQKASEMGSSLVATIGICTITGFFTFITPVLIHLVTRKYVTSVEYNEKNDEYMATVISFFLKPKQASIFNFNFWLAFLS
uniref:Transmembrane protein n=1 Tax=Sipha flava TaxID=143950 RepID=A0A2S2QSM0_9HEMI